MATDYVDAPITFKVRKVARYVRLYGLTRTLSKIRSQLHVHQAPDESAEPIEMTWVNPYCRGLDHPDRYVALIGAGNFAYSTIAHYCRGANRRFLRSVFDVNGARAIGLCRAYRGGLAVPSPDEIAQDPQVRLVYIASNHASHSEYAVMMLEAGKDVHIEKPHVVNGEQLRRLEEAMARNPERSIYLGFNRPWSPIFAEIESAIGAEPGELMINWFVAGHEIPSDHWYFSEAEGGRLLGNVCHWTDLTLRLVGIDKAFPLTVKSGLSVASPSDFVLSYQFADGSAGAITFSAKGHAFEGVREVLNLHRGSTMVYMSDFQHLRIDSGHKTRERRLLTRQHGHRENILNSLRRGHPVPPDEVRATALVFLGTRAAAESGEAISVDP